LRRWFGVPVLVIEVKGRRTGKTRLVSTWYVRLADGYAVIAANAGSDKTPSWWLNLRDGRAGVVHLDGRREDIVPRLADGIERHRIWEQMLRDFPSVPHYSRYTARQFPIVILERRSAGVSL
jgi:deazaflavin-dependent oxidoreductase (nitroreductase family)